METDKPKRKKPAPISYRPPIDKRAAFYEMHELSGLSVSAFITECIFGRSRHRPSELKALAQIISQCASIREQLDKVSISPSANTILLEQATEELVLIRSALMHLMGRRS